MQPFLQKCIGVSLVLIAAGFCIRSVQPAYAEKVETSSFAVKEEQRKLFWINTDTINVYYKPLVEMMENDAKAFEEMDKEFREKVIAFEERSVNLQQRAAAGTISADEAFKEESELRTSEMALLLQEERLAAMQNMLIQKNDSITRNIAEYLKTYAEKHNADYVFMHGPGSPMIYANEKLDITKEALTGLNAEYDRKKRK